MLNSIDMEQDVPPGIKLVYLLLFFSSSKTDDRSAIGHHKKDEIPLKTLKWGLGWGMRVDCFMKTFAITGQGTVIG